MSVVLIFATVVMAILKFAKLIDWSWWIVFLPTLIIVGILTAEVLFVVFMLLLVSVLS